MHKLPHFSCAAQLFVALMGLCFLPVAVPAFAASMSISPTSIQYGNNPVNSGAYQYVTLRNSGSYTVKVSSASITGSFKFSGITTPLYLRPGRTVSIQLKFVPKTTGTFTGTFSVSAQNTSRVTVALSGTASGSTGGSGGSTSGTLTVSPTSFGFGNVTVGSTATQTVTFKAGSSPVIISGATTTNQEFTLTNLSLPKTIAAGQSISVGVNFTPASSGSTSTTFTITANSTNSSSTFSATGAGVSTKQHAVALTWTPSKSNVVGYDVYRGTASGGPYTRLNGSAVVSSSYTDNTVKSGSTYFYVTTAVNSSSIESVKSNEVRAAIPTP